MGVHIVDGEFQSDKYPTTPRGKVPLSVKDVTAQDLLWEYAQRRRKVDAEFSDDLETALKTAGFTLPKTPPNESPLAMMVRDLLTLWDRGELARGAFEIKMRETICHFARVYIPIAEDLWKLKLVAKLAYQFKFYMQKVFVGGTKIDPFWTAIDDLPTNLLNEAHAEMKEAQADQRE